MVPPCSDRISRVPPYSRTRSAFYPYGAVTRYGPPFQTVPVLTSRATGLVRVRSPLLTESRLMSFPPGTEMFQFPGFASATYGFSGGYLLAEWVAPFGDPRIKACSRLPGLFAACHVLHRLLAPRHPPDALAFLDPRQRQPQHPMRCDRAGPAVGAPHRPEGRTQRHCRQRPATTTEPGPVPLRRLAIPMPECAPAPTETRERRNAHADARRTHDARDHGRSTACPRTGTHHHLTMSKEHHGSTPPSRKRRATCMQGSPSGRPGNTARPTTAAAAASWRASAGGPGPT